METKKCSKCEQLLQLSDFYKRAGASSYHSACKVCERGMAKDWYERNREKAKSKYQEWRERNQDAIKSYRAENRRKHYQQEVIRKYGVDAEWFDNRMLEQSGKCDCCGTAFEWGNKQTAPHVDHCHDTQTVRGILCNRCNSVIGLCKDNAGLLSRMARYLRKCHGSSAKR